MNEKLYVMSITIQIHFSQEKIINVCKLVQYVQQKKNNIHLKIPYIHFSVIILLEQSQFSDIL